MTFEPEEEGKAPHLRPVLSWHNQSSARAVVVHGNKTIPVIPADASRLREEGAVSGTPVEYEVVRMKDGTRAAKITSASIDNKKERYKRSKTKLGRGADRAPKSGVRFVSGGSPGLGKKKGR